MTKEDRLKLMKTIGARLDVQARMESTTIRPSHSESDDEVVVTPKKRGRPKKESDEAPIASIESFNYSKLSDDAGVLQPHEQDIQDELAKMNTYL